MRSNRHKPHVLVLPEDDANRQVANGFIKHPDVSATIQVLRVAGGWMKVLDCFEADHLSTMDAFPDRFMVLLIDFDGQEDRLDRAKTLVPDRLKDRVFVLGVWTKPESLRTAVGRPYEKIGLQLAEDCRAGTTTTWDHVLLRHNAVEVARLREKVRPFLFQSI